MFRKLYIILLLMPGLLPLQAQYIAEVLSYRPAPGQFINELPWGTPSSAESIVGGVNGTLSLGAFGGEVVFRFEGPVENHVDNPYGVDFTIFGNPMPSWSEPAAVWVMKDENENGLADDTWYELAGSDHYFSSTRRNARVVYYNPGEEALDVPWEAEGVSGYIRANSAHQQSYYPDVDSFPGISAERLEISATQIMGMVDVNHPPLIISRERAFGYADNRLRAAGPDTLPDNPYSPELENSGGDAFDISWAVDSLGMHVDLDRIHFIRVQTALLHEGGYLGEVSTEICGAADVEPVPGMTGEKEILVLADLPAELSEGSYPLELFFFREGRPRTLPDIEWTLSASWASIDEARILHLSGAGPLEIRAAVKGKPWLSSVIQTEVIPAVTGSEIRSEDGRTLILYPNPAGEKIYLSGAEGSHLCLFDTSGKLLMQRRNYMEGSGITVQALRPGIYFLSVDAEEARQHLKFVKK